MVRCHRGQTRMVRCHRGQTRMACCRRGQMRMAEPEMSIFRIETTVNILTNEWYKQEYMHAFMNLYFQIFAYAHNASYTGVNHRRNYPSTFMRTTTSPARTAWATQDGNKYNNPASRDMREIKMQVARFRPKCETSNLEAANTYINAVEKKQAPRHTQSWSPRSRRNNLR